jgi:precorrin-2/cobalt-factor-2 C20-methyltransferase
VNLGTFFGIGVGPGDPELITLKGKQILENAKYVFVPKARVQAESIALSIAKRHMSQFAQIQEIVFPMVEDKESLKTHWREAARSVIEVLTAGEDAVFITIGDALFYSTHIYLMRALKEALPDLQTQTVPGVTAFSAAAALTSFPVGEGKYPVLIVPMSDDMEAVDRALAFCGTVVLMKVGKRLEEIVRLLSRHGLASQSVFVARAGLDGERIETDLTLLTTEDPHVGYLSCIIVDARKDISR